MFYLSEKKIFSSFKLQIVDLVELSWVAGTLVVVEIMDLTPVHSRLQVSQVHREQHQREEAHHQGEESPAEVGEEVVTAGETHDVLKPLSLNVVTGGSLHHHQPVDLVHVDRLEKPQDEGSVHHHQDGGDEEEDEGVVEDERGEVRLISAVFLDKVSLETRVLQGVPGTVRAGAVGAVQGGGDEERGGEDQQSLGHVTESKPRALSYSL